MDKIPQIVLDQTPSIKKIWRSIDFRVRNYWNEVQNSLLDSIIIPIYQEGNINGWSYHANIQPKVLTEEEMKYFNCSKLFLLAVPEKFNSYDVAHELSHIAVFTIHGYSFLDQQYIKSNNEARRKMLRKVSSVYDAAIHPVIDNILKERNLFSEKFYKRKHKDIVSVLNHYITALNDKDCITEIIIPLIEAKHRLPISRYENLMNYARELQLDSFITSAMNLPIYDFDYTDPNAVDKAIVGTWKELNLDLHDNGIVRLVDKNQKNY